MANIDVLLQQMVRIGASDVHLKTGQRPRFRVRGQLEDAEGFPQLAADDLHRLLSDLLSPEHRQQHEARQDLDFAYGNPRIGRFRCNVFWDQWGPAAVFRRIPNRIPSLKELNLPAELEQFAHLQRGLVLVTGASGSGKTSTLAALLNVINECMRRHVITLEDPIEYMHQMKTAVIHQRGLHYDFPDFEAGIVSALRQDPNVILIGELRDVESIRQALVAAEVGVLVLATLHTNSAAEAVDRIIDVFSSSEQPQVRTQLAQCLAGVISQILMTRIDAPGRIPATEVLVATPAVGNLIREGRTQDIQNVIQSGKVRGMHTLDDSLERLVRAGTIDPLEAATYARNRARFEENVPTAKDSGRRAATRG